MMGPRLSSLLCQLELNAVAREYATRRLEGGSPERVNIAMALEHARDELKRAIQRLIEQRARESKQRGGRR